MIWDNWFHSQVVKSPNKQIVIELSRRLVLVVHPMSIIESSLNISHLTPYSAWKVLCSETNQEQWEMLWHSSNKHDRLSWRQAVIQLCNTFENRSINTSRC